jgi:hypothetical protein
LRHFDATTCVILTQPLGHIYPSDITKIKISTYIYRLKMSRIKKHIDFKDDIFYMFPTFKKAYNRIIKKFIESNLTWEEFLKNESIKQKKVD